MGRKLEIDWHETASELKKRYQKERNAERRTRLHAFWQLRIGKTMKEVAELAGIGYRTLQDWMTWYRHGGLAEVLQRIKGHGNQDRPAKLTALQQKALAAKVALVCFRNVWDAIQWIRDRWKVHYGYSGLFSRLKRLKCRLKVPPSKSLVHAQSELMLKHKMSGNQPAYWKHYGKLRWPVHIGYGSAMKCASASGDKHENAGSCAG